MSKREEAKEILKGFSLPKAQQNASGRKSGFASAGMIEMVRRWTLLPHNSA